LSFHEYNPEPATSWQISSPDCLSINYGGTLCLLTAEFRVQSWVASSDIRDGRNGTKPDFSPSSCGFSLVTIIPPLRLTHLSASHEMCNVHVQATHHCSQSPVLYVSQTRHLACFGVKVLQFYKINTGMGGQLPQLKTVPAHDVLGKNMTVAHILFRKWRSGLLEHQSLPVWDICFSRQRVWSLESSGM
jgi:hypothetical protein